MGCVRGLFGDGGRASSSTDTPLPDSRLERGGKTDDGAPAASGPRAAVFRIVAVLLVGAFTANADGSLVLATHPTIASQFNALSSSSWLFVSYSLAGAASQAMVSDGPRHGTDSRRAVVEI